jgi:hypothetical protein
MWSVRGYHFRLHLTLVDVFLGEFSNLHRSCLLSIGSILHHPRFFDYHCYRILAAISNFEIPQVRTQLPLSALAALY